jgi:riboflavin transporter FmnP
MYPLFNLPVLIALYKYRLSKTEVIIESICLVLAITYFYDVVKFFVPHHLLWNHQTVDGREVFERVWWYEHDLNIIYGICITIFLCLVYFKVKKMLGGKRSLREGKDN